MEAQLKKVGEADARYVPPAREFTSELSPGRYRLEVTCVRRNNRVKYQVGVWPSELLPGLDRTVTPPAAIPISLGKESLVEISSLGSIDVRARLYDADERLVAESDDRPQDWNFQIAARLRAGQYLLQVDPLGGAETSAVPPPETQEASEEVSQVDEPTETEESEAEGDVDSEVDSEVDVTPATQAAPEIDTAADAKPESRFVVSMLHAARNRRASSLPSVE